MPYEYPDPGTPRAAGGARPTPASDTRLSPDQTIKLELLISEWSPSLWIHAPRLTEIATGHVMLDLWGTSWDAQTAWVGSSGLRLDLRRYDQGGALTVLLDFLAGTYRLGDPGALACPLTDIRRGIEAASEPARRLYLESLKTPDGADDTPPPDAAVRHDDAPLTPTASILGRFIHGLAARFKLTMMNGNQPR
jgi:hypothetical protein